MADYSNALLSGASLIQTGAEVGSAWAQSQALRAQGDFAMNMAEINQRFADERARDVVRAGETQARQTRRRANQTIGAQRAAAAASGIAVDDGSAADATSETVFESEDDQITQRNNAWREAFGIKTQAAINLSSARMQARGQMIAANATLLGGVMSAGASAMKAAGYGLKAFNDQNLPDPNQTLLSGNAVETPNDRDYSLGVFDPQDRGFRSAFLKSDLIRREGR